MTIPILMSKIVFIKYLPPVRPKIGPKMRGAQNLLKFGRFDISNMAIPILMSKIVFIKYLPPVRPKIWYFNHADPNKG